MNRDTLLLIAAGLLLFVGLGTGAVIYMGTRGIRNNNPGNIRHGSSQWQGMSLQQTDPEYIQFDDPVYGIRAMAKLLTNYQMRYGLNTVDEIISRWAPPIENVTAKYIENVSDWLGVSPDHEINVATALPQLIPAIIKQENGKQPYTAEQIAKGISLA